MIGHNEVLQVLLSFPPYYADRFDTLEQRTELFTPSAVAIARAANGNRTRAAALVAVWKHESGNGARYVLEGRCQDGPRGARCDWDYKLKRPKSITAFQVQSWCTEAWDAPHNSQEQLNAAARCVIRQWEGGRKRCGKLVGDWAGGFAGLTGGACIWPGSAPRVKTMELARMRLSRAQ